MLRAFSISVYLKSKAGKRKPEDFKVPHKQVKRGRRGRGHRTSPRKGEEWHKGPMHVGDCGVDKWIPDSCSQRGLDLLLPAVSGRHWVFFLSQPHTNAMLFKSAGERKHSYLFVRTLDICYLTFDIHTHSTWLLISLPLYHINPVLTFSEADQPSCSRDNSHQFLSSKTHTFFCFHNPLFTTTVINRSILASLTETNARLSPF